MLEMQVKEQTMLPEIRRQRNKTKHEEKRKALRKLRYKMGDDAYKISREAVCKRELKRRLRKPKK
jgi:hypothetical protein